MTAHQRLVAHLASGTVDEADTAHAARCTACAALLPPSSHPPAAAPRPEWLLAARRELRRPPRPWWALPLGLAALNALLATAAVFVLQAWNWDVSRSPRWLFLTAATVLAALATAGALLALAPGRRWLQVGLLLAALAPLAVLLAADGRVGPGPFLSGGWACLVQVVLLSLLPLASGLWLLTRVAYAPARALAVGLASAGVGLLALQFHCDAGSRGHLLVFHLLPWAVLGGVAVLLRRRLPTASYAP